MTQPRVTILYNEPTLPVDHPDAESEYDILYTADIVAKVLIDAGLPVSRLGITSDPAALLFGLKQQSPDVIFNLYEGMASWGNTEAFVSGILELLQIPFTGSPTQPILIGKSKPLTKQMLAGAGLPTARFFVVDQLPMPPCDLPWPVIVKPGKEDASIGIDQGSVVTNQEDLEERVAHIMLAYGAPVLVEQFVSGREFNVPIWDRTGTPEALPFTEILFLEQDGHDPLWPIVSFDAKWKPASRDFKATPAKNPAEDVSAELHAKVSAICVKAYELLGCRDYGRVDLRLSPAGEPYILEVNPNPCISPLAGLAAALETAKVPYSEFILSVLRSALRRGPKPELAEIVGAASLAKEVKSLPTQAKRGWNVRAALKTDVDDLIELLDAAEGISVAERSAIGKQLRLRSRKKDWGGATILVLAGRTRLGGFAMVDGSHPIHGNAQLEMVVVDPTLRRTGLGQLLLTAIETGLSASGVHMVFAELTSGATASSTRQLLSSAGFHPAGEVAEFFKDGCSRLTLAKVLPASSTPIVAIAEPLKTIAAPLIG